MKFKRDILLNALTTITPGLTPSGVVDAMRNAFFTGTDLIAFNEQIGILFPFETDFVASVNNEDLVNIVTKIEASELELTVENEELRISSEATNAGLLMYSTEEIDENLNLLIDQIPNDQNDLEWTELPNDFLSGIALCIPAADTKLQLQTLACVYADKNILMASNNDRVSHYTLNGSLDTSFFIRAGLLKELSKFAVTKFCATDAWVAFGTEDDIVFAAKKVYGTPMDMYLPMFEGFEGKEVPLPEGLKEVVTAAAVMAVDSVAKNMEIVMQNGEMICTTQNERGWVTKSIPVKTVGEKAVELQVSATYLQQILDLPDLKMIVGEGRSLFTSGNFKHVLAHMIEG